MPEESNRGGGRGSRRGSDRNHGFRDGGRGKSNKKSQGRRNQGPYKPPSISNTGQQDPLEKIKDILEERYAKKSTGDVCHAKLRSVCHNTTLAKQACNEILNMVLDRDENFAGECAKLLHGGLMGPGAQDKFGLVENVKEFLSENRLKEKANNYVFRYIMFISNFVGLRETYENLEYPVAFLCKSLKTQSERVSTWNDSIAMSFHGFLIASGKVLDLYCWDKEESHIDDIFSALRKCIIKGEGSETTRCVCLNLLEARSNEWTLSPMVSPKNTR
eukprot:m.72574 g.72574  ORF g.72574 m.72574 type:complete len:274 (+) comp12335_c0_seq1:126-947(+)